MGAISTAIGYREVEAMCDTISHVAICTIAASVQEHRVTEVTRVIPTMEAARIFISTGKQSSATADISSPNSICRTADVTGDTIIAAAE
jgi:hypothetical protein